MRFTASAMCMMSLIAGVPAHANPEPIEEVTLSPVTALTSEEEPRPSAFTTRIAADTLPQGAPSGADLTARAVSLQLTRPDNRNTGLFVRGLGSTSYNDGLSGSVGATTDGVALGRQGMFVKRPFDVESFDVQRTPVLTGPGPATSVGAIHMRTRAPQWHDEAELRTSRGSDGFESHEAVVGGALIDGTLAARFSGYSQRRAGQVRNLATGQGLNDEHHDGLRGQLLWQPGNALRARLIVERSRLDENCCAYVATHYSAATLGRAAALGYTLPPADLRQRAVAQDGRNRAQMAQDAATLHLDFDLPGGQRLSSITGWRAWRYDTRYDLDSIALAIAPQGRWNMDHRQWSQELQLEGAMSDTLGYRVGAYYLHQTHTRNGSLRYGPDAARWFSVGMALPPIPPDVLADMLDGGTVRLPGSQTATTRALFGQLDWAVRPDLDLTASARYSLDRKDADNARRISGLRPLPLDPVQAAVAAQLRQALIGTESSGRFSRRDNSLDGALQARLRPRDGMQWAFGLSTGYKPGGINSDPVGRAVSPRFAPERSVSLEAGVTLDLPHDGHLRVGVYQTTIRDYQTLSYDPESSPLIPLMNNLINVKRVRSRGVELETEIALSNTLRLSAGAGYNDARYSDFDNAPCPPGSGTLYCDFSGLQMAHAPRWTAFAGLQHEHGLAGGQVFRAGVGYQWRSGYYGATERGRGSYVAPRGLVDAHVGLGNRHWEVTLWVRNLTDRDYATATYALNGGGDYGALIGEPRLVGVSLSLRM